MHDADRLRERALALPIACLVLFSPPLLTILGRPASIAGVPLAYLYIFGAWLGLILLGRALARGLMAPGDAASQRASARSAHGAGSDGEA